MLNGHILQPEPADENFIGVARAVRHSSYSEQYLHRLVRKPIIRAVRFATSGWSTCIHCRRTSTRQPTRTSKTNAAVPARVTTEGRALAKEVCM